MEDAKKIYSLLLRSDGLKIREIAQTLEMDNLYVAELLFSEECNPLWYQNDDSLWFAKIGALKIEEEDNDIVERNPLFEIIVNANALDIKQFREIGVSDDALLIISEISKYRVFTDDQTHELFLKYDDGDKDAYDLLVKGNLRHVVAVARLFLNTGISFEDIFQEGVIGLLEAIKKFDFQRSRNFTYFAKLGIYRYLDLSLKSLQFQVKISPRHIYLHRLIRRFCDDYVQRENMEPPFEFVEIKDEVSPDYLKPIYNLPSDLQEMVVAKNNWDEVADETFLADKQMMNDSRRFNMLQLVHSLPPRMCEILESCFGLNGRSEESLDMIGTRLNLTRERVRQIKEEGVKILKRFVRVKLNAAYDSEPVREKKRGVRGNQFSEFSKEETTKEIIKKQVLRTTSLPPHMIEAPKETEPSFEERFQLDKADLQGYHPQRKTRPDVVLVTTTSQTTSNIKYQKRQDLRRAIKKALEHYTVPATPNDVAIVVRKILPQSFDFNSADVESIMFSMNDVELVQDRKYILKSKKDIGAFHKTKPVEKTKKKSEVVAHQRFSSSTRLDDLVDLKIITKKECKHCHHKGLSTIGDVNALIQRYHLTRQSDRFTQYTLDIWFKIVDLLKDEKRGEPVKEIIETQTNNDLDGVYTKYLNMIMRIRQAKRYSEVIVAKPVLLLAVLEGIGEKEIKNNRIILNNRLEQRYEALMQRYTQHSIFSNFSPINNPFWHLVSDGFWHLTFRRKQIWGITPSTKWLKENISYASFDDELWNMLQNDLLRKQLGEEIIQNKIKK